MNFVLRNITLAGLTGLAVLTGASVTHAKEITVGLVESMTGPVSFIGAPMRDGALLREQEINQTHFFGPDTTFKIVWGDDANDRGQAVTLIQKYSSDPNVLAIMGPTAGSVAMAGIAAANDTHIASLATTNSRVAAAVGKYAFAFTPPPDVMMPDFARYALGTLKIKSCATIGLHDNEPMLTTENIFVDLMTKGGTKFVTREAIKGTDSDFAAVATKIASLKDIDCVFVSAFAPQAANIIIQLRLAGLSKDIRVLTQSSAASPDLIAKGGSAVEGVYLLASGCPVALLP